MLCLLVLRVKMADTVASGLGDGKEKEKETEDKEKGKEKEKEKQAQDIKTGSEKLNSTPEITETLGFYERKVNQERKRSLSDLSLLRFISTELTRGYFLEHNEAKYTERRERVYTCMRIPRELEKLMLFGFFLCLDAFLYVFTLLPLRAVLALIRLITLPCCGLNFKCLFGKQCCFMGYKVYSEYRASLAFDLVSSRQKNLTRVVTSSVKIQGSLAFVCVLLFYLGLITLKVLNSIVLLGKSCLYVKEAKMEEKLFQTPPATTPGKPPNKSKNKFQAPPGIPTNNSLSASITSQPVHQSESTSPLLPNSNSDQFLTTPDAEEKDITQDGSELKHRASNKDLLEIDRFTICGNRID
ncbi:UNVERIFIED_CONTAM: hypothetical protein FKN15_035587 [Acipenser sinensis]